MRGASLRDALHARGRHGGDLPAASSCSSSDRFDLVVLGEGERPLLDIAGAAARGSTPRAASRGTAERVATARSCSCRSGRSSATDLRDAIFSTPYEKMPYAAYWDRLESAYQLGALPSKAAREAHLAEIRSVRLITLNYCPMGCTFCSATNFLHHAQGSVAAIARPRGG